MLISKQLTFEQVKEEFTNLFLKPPQPLVLQNLPFSPQDFPSNQFNPELEVKNLPSSSSSSSFQSNQGNSSELTEDRVRDYVNQLYLTYIGRKGDPANTEWLVNSILKKEYSLGMAEKFVKFSKEAKAYQKATISKRNAQIHDYIKELFRVYANNLEPTEEEMKEYTDAITNKTRSLQEIENEFKLMALNPPKKK